MMQQLITTTALVPLLLATLAGGLLGAMFYGGLWWTVRVVLTAAHPGLWVGASLLLRMGGALGGMYLVGGSQWPRLLACLVGFVIARAAVTWLTRLPRGAGAVPAVPTVLTVPTVPTVVVQHAP
jgi:F1F0 ATPase subunit 2